MLALPCSALVLAAAPAAFQSPPFVADLVVPVVSKGDTIATQGGTATVVDLGRPVAGTGAGWVTDASLTGGGTPIGRRAIIGQLPGGLQSPPVVLREPATIAGVTQRDLRPTSMRGGSLGYVAFDEASCSSLWIDDQLILRRDDPVQGEPGFRWSYFEVQLTAAGTAFIRGTARPAGGGDPRGLLVEWPSMERLLVAWRPTPGVAAANSNIGQLSFSPDGQHWVAGLRNDFPSDRTIALIADGQLVDLGGGALAVADAPVPASIVGAGVGASWYQFRHPVINNQGVVAFTGTSMASSSFEEVDVRGARPFRSGFPAGEFRSFLGLDTRGVAIQQQGNAGGFFVEGRRLMVSVPGIDADGDGVADPGSTFTPSYSSAPTAIHESQSFLVVRGLASVPGLPPRPMIARAQDYRIDREACDGVPNSTGFPGALVGTGDPRVVSNGVTLQAFDLPAGSSGYAIVSRNFGISVAPGGSVGNLCLAAPIGRLRSQTFLTGLSGRVAIDLDLAHLPQPTGSVSAMANQTWFAQAWYRDAVQGLSTSNFTGAISLTFQ